MNGLAAVTANSAQNKTAETCWSKKIHILKYWL